MQQEIEDIYRDNEAFRDRIATVDKQGKRVWMHPKKPQGKLYNARTLVSIILLFIFFIGPWLKINGNPLFMLNVIEREFYIFGIFFRPQDFHILGLSTITLFVFIILFTVSFGRIFCGWVCPQTIFMEMVFRKIEYLIEGDSNQQRRLRNQPWNGEKIFKKGIKLLIFFIISFLIAHTFLSYIIGPHSVLEIMKDPLSEHLSGFLTMMAFIGVFMFVFTWLREQVCIAICPYGRLQGVLLGKDSIVISYDNIRGEPRGKLRKSKKGVESPVDEPAMGDCIDCEMCIKVCPTGIDIRNGTQLECVNCTACIDACDQIMDKVGKPRKLIRYDSLVGIETGEKKIFRPRTIAYSAVLVLLLGIVLAIFFSRTDVETLLLKTPGSLYEKSEEGVITNMYNFQVINKTSDEFEVSFKLEYPGSVLRTIGDETPLIPANGQGEGILLIDIPADQLLSRKTILKVDVYSDGEIIDNAKTTFLGPLK